MFCLREMDDFTTAHGVLASRTFSPAVTQLTYSAPPQAPGLSLTHLFRSALRRFQGQVSFLAFEAFRFSLFVLLFNFFSNVLVSICTI